MTGHKLWTAFPLMLVLAFAAACGLSAGETPTPRPDMPVPAIATTAPAPPPTPVPTPEPPATGGTWKAEVVWGCDLEHAGGSSTWTADLAYEFTVGADGALSGTGSGTFRRYGCTLHGCQCESQPGPISLDVSGLQQDDTFYIKLVPPYDLTECVTCPEVETKCSGGIRQLEWCHCSAAGGPLEVNIRVADHVARDFECNPRTGGSMSAFAEGWTEIKRVEP